MEKDICDLCNKEVEEDEIYHIESYLGHLECFEKAVDEYIANHI